MDKYEIIHILNEIADILEIQNENPFRVRAYRNAARTLENLSQPLEKLVKEEKLDELEGIGKDLAEKISTLHTKGKLPYYAELKKTLPKGLLELLKVEGLGAKKTKVLYEKLKITNKKDLEEACKKGKIASLKGFGKKTEENILSSLGALENYSTQTLWWEANEIATSILEALQNQKSVINADIAGSIRRKKETVKDIDFVAASEKPKEVMDWYTKQDCVASIIAKGNTKSSIRLKNGLQADLRIVPESQYGFTVHHFTGSKEHNIHLRTIAKQKGWKVSEWGITSVNKTPCPLEKTKKMVTEKEIYQAFDMQFIPPELREDTGELEIAKMKKLPILVEEKDIQGAFHVHTRQSDGKNSIEEMVEEAENLGWKYIGISDHSKSSTQANGLDEKRLLSQIEAIQKLNKSKKFKTHIFSGTECDILTNGKLDFENNILKELDFVIISIHRAFKLDQNTMTARLIKAIENPYTTMVGHLTGRLLLKREPYPLNIPKVIDAAIANKKIIEINGQPQRLDIDWRHLHKAKEKGLLTCINPDAHNLFGLQFVKTGVNIARKGWLEKKDVLNTWDLSKVKSYLKK